MQHLCEDLHRWANSLPVFKFPFDVRALPFNGIYLLFEKGEIAHGTNRIVRVGTHTGINQLQSRLKQHFLVENKDRSIFRKNIGRALLNRDRDPFLSDWELDLTASKAKEQHSGHVDMTRQQIVEFPLRRSAGRRKETTPSARVEIDLDNFSLRDLSTVAGLARPIFAKGED
jgi:hypothetical protein